MDKELLYDLYFNKEMSYRDIAEKLNCSISVPRLWLKKYNFKPRDRKSACKLRCIKKPQTNPGREDMPKNANYGEDNHMYKGGFVNKQGYKIISINGVSKHEHRYVWEQNNGKIPKGHQIHHKDFNKLNNHISNLECLTNSEHQRLHLEYNGRNSKGQFE